MVDSRSEHTQTEDRPKKRFRLVMSKAENFEDVRCPDCGALLYRELKKSASSDRTIQIKCRRCGEVSMH